MADAANAELNFAKNVGYAFIKVYYQKSSFKPAELSYMYSKDSTFMRWSGGEAKPSIGAVGVEEIKAKLEAQPRCKYQLTYVDCTPSYRNTILISVGGKAHAEDASKEFQHTFVIAPNASQPDTFYIHTDMMRTCQEESHYVPERSAPVAPVVPAPPSPPAPVAPVEPAPVYEEVPPVVEEVHQVEEPAQPEAEVEAMINDVVDEEQVQEEAVEQLLAEEPEPEVAQPEPEVEAVPEPEPEPEVEEEKVVEPEPEPEVEEEKPRSWAARLTAKSKAPAAAPIKQVVTAPGQKREATNKVVDTSDRKKTDNRAALGLEKYFGKGSKGAKGAKGEAPRSREYSHGGSLYVRNLPKDFSEDDCEKLFGAFGKVSGKTIKAADGYAFVDFETRGAMEKALEKSLSFGGNTLNVQEKKQQPNRNKDGKEVRNTRRERN